LNLTLSAEQEQLVDSFAALFARESTSERVRAAEPLGFDPKLWKALLDTGVLEMAVAEEAGGSGASVAELALTAEQFGRAVASAPMIEAQVAGCVLASCGAAAEELLAAALEGHELITFAPRSYRGPSLSMVPAGAVADVVVALVDGQLLAITITDRPRQVENLGSMPLADIVVGDEVTVLADGPRAVELHSGALDMWLALTAAALAGAAARAVEIGVE
jgi:alkylation response protein AidB-like acyl-CoA dehydrogenase